MARHTATAMRADRAELLEFVRTRHRAVLITTRRDGRPSASPVTCGLDPNDRIVIATYPERAKVQHVRRDDRVSACILSDDWNGPYVHIDGHADVLDLPDALEPLIEYFRSVSGEHPDWAEYRQAMRDQGKCLLRIHIEQWGPIATGGFPARLAGA